MPSILNATTSSGLVTSADNSGSLQLATNNGTTAVTIDTSQNVGIGTASPSHKLTVTNAGATSFIVSKGESGQASYLTACANNGTVGTSSLDVIQLSDGTGYLYLRANQPLIFGTNNTERGRFDASGNFLFNSGYGSVATAYGCRAWVNFNGTGTVAIRGSGNVSSITDDGLGLYRVNFTNSMPDANYATVISTEESGTTCMTSHNNTVQQTSASAYVRCTIGTTETNYDPQQFNVSVFR
jgi:hypothetical protein